MSFGELLAFLSVWGAIAWGLYRAATVVEDNAKPLTKRRVHLWLSGLDPAKSARNLSRFFGHSFDRIFGTRHWTWSCFLKSCLASLASLGLLYLMHLWYFDAWDSWELSLELGFIGAEMIPICNVIPDYISLRETR